MCPRDSLLKKLYYSALDLLFPEEGICFICDKYDEDVKEDHICSDCKDKLLFINENRCPTCGKPNCEGNALDRCSYCANKTFYFTKAFSPLEFTGIIRKTIYKYKYESKPYIYKSFGELMLRTLERENVKDDIDIIVPVPLHRSRKAERGYNQSELLAKYLSSKLDIPMDTRNLKRIKSTKVQNKLGRTERHLNVKDAFKVKDMSFFKSKKILLVDDIFTTGATVNECSRVLMESGAREVLVITIATGRHT
ncbi:ComF family protein [Proteiniborus sp.]|uniref:ComF family protein n=1 Tax=Proteiniborus sp. TaxID=2079015 RepID=UPI00332D111E